MEKQFLSVEEFNALLNQWNGHDIKILKYEMGDEDETTMALKTISYSKNTRRIDDYEPMHALKLNGIGKVETEDQEHKPLPKSLYEIPIEDSTQFQFDGKKFSLITDRGIYTIESK